MSDTRKIKLEKLLSDNKIKQAKSQLINDLMKYRNIDISNKEFVDYSLSEEVHKKAYILIKTNEVKLLSCPFNEETLKLKLNFIFDYFKKYDKEIVLFYPSTFGLYFRSSNQLYLNYPIAIKLRLEETQKIIMKLLLEIHDDLLVVSEDFNFGFILSEDEYSKVTIEYWGE